MYNDNNTIVLQATANTTGAYFDFSPSFQYPVLACHILIVLIAVIGNVIVKCGAIIVNKNLRSSPTNTFIFSLAFSDLLTVSLVVPFDIESIILLGPWRHNEELCQAWITMYLITVPTSILTLLAVSVDCYKNLSDPLNRFRRCRFMTRKKALILDLQHSLRFNSHHGLSHVWRVRVWGRMLLSLHQDLHNALFCDQLYSSTVSHFLHLHQDIPDRQQPAKYIPRRRLTNFRISLRWGEKSLLKKHESS